LEKEKDLFEITATTFLGLEEVLAKELETIGAKNILIKNRAVSFHGDNEILYSACYKVRTALKILKTIDKFRITDANSLYDKAFEIKWNNFFNVRKTFSIDTVVKSTLFNHSNFVGLKVKDAIADKFRALYDKRPSVDTDSPDIKIIVHLSNDFCTISLDASGETLFKRGYRAKPTAAPLNEVLTAGILGLTEWDKKTTLLDLMCGSGTIPIEASLLSMNVPSGYLRTDYSFQNWKDYDEVLWNDVKEKYNSLITTSNVEIIANDIDKEVLTIARLNSRTTKIENNIKFFNQDFFEFSNQENCLLIINPPYDERVKSDNVNDFYKRIGDKLKQSFTGSTAWVLSGNLEAIKHIGLKPSKRITLFNGSIECKLLKFELYSGTKRQG